MLALLRKSFCLLSVLYLVSIVMAPSSFAARVREPVWAGSFYPEAKSSLEALISDLTEKASETPVMFPSGRKLKALVLPHAGYIYSGWTAAHASHVLTKGDYSRVVLLGPDHRVGIRNGAISDAELFRTPLGFVKLHENGELLRKRSDLFTTVEASDNGEHSLEVILPFLQYYLGSFELVPIVLGQSDIKGVAGSVSTILDDETLLVVSSDLSHYLSYEEAVVKDRQTLDQILGLVDNKLIEDKNSACGGEGLLVLIALARRYGWKPELLHYSNSGDTAGGRNRVVGYATIAFFGDDKMADGKGVDQIGIEHGKVLVKLARQTIREKITGKIDPAMVVEMERELSDPVFQTRRGVFVTLHKGGQLRGCIGSLTGSAPIAEGVRRNALNAAFNDYRFQPVKGDELEDIDLEVSVLTDPQPFDYDDPMELVHGIRPKIDGLIIRKGRNSATFLPQVWDQLPVPEDFLSHLCRKAGLAADEWKHGGLEVQTYQVQYFAEDK